MWHSHQEAAPSRAGWAPGGLFSGDIYARGEEMQGVGADDRGQEVGLVRGDDMTASIAASLHSREGRGGRLRTGVPSEEHQEVPRFPQVSAGSWPGIVHSACGSVS